MPTALKYSFAEIAEMLDEATKDPQTAKKIDVAQHPTLIPKALFLADIPLIAKGEIATIVALPSSGKSNMLEGIAASYFEAKGHETVDTLSFFYPEENTNSHKKVLWIDTERTENDILFSVQRLRNRLKNIDISNEIDIFSFVEILSPDLCIEELEKLCNTGNYDIVLIDGVLDFCPDMNHIEKCTYLVKKLRALAIANDVAIVTTIHPNKGTETVAGHLGAMLYRYSRAMLYIKKDLDKRLLTSEGAQGKLSYSSEAINVHFAWNTEQSMFTVCDAPEENHAIDTEIVKSVFNGMREMWTADFKREYAIRLGLKKDATNKRCRLLIANGIIELIGNTKTARYKYIEVDEEIPF